MRIALQHRLVAASILAAVLAGSPAAAQVDAVRLLEDRLPAICAELQAQGWGVPADLLKMSPGTRAETRIAGIGYYRCSVERRLPGKGPGRAPDLGALLIGGDGDPSLILSVNVWCAADRGPAIEGLAQELERVLAGSKIAAPAEMLAALRAARAYESTAGGYRYIVEPIEVDKGACARVRPGQLGAVLMKIDVVVEPAGLRVQP